MYVTHYTLKLSLSYTHTRSTITDSLLTTKLTTHQKLVYYYIHKHAFIRDGFEIHLHLTEINVNK